MLPGTVLAGRFEIERKASSGGMGTVHRARDLRVGGYVAIKMLRAGAGDEDRRFEREARLLAQLDHPGIVRYVDHGQTEAEVAWLAMEWLEGEDLSHRLARGRLPLDDVAALARGAADALSAAHARGVVHRDVKPSNLFLPGGSIERVKLIDFGIAHGAHELVATLSGVVVGTPSYMAPEQARGAPDVDRRADLFSLGCVLYECLAGRPPFEGRHAMAVLAKILFEEAPKLRGLRPDVPPALEGLVMRMLSKDPAERPAGGAEVAAAIASGGDGGAAASLPRALTAREQRLVSVIVAGSYASPAAETVQIGESRDDLEGLERAVGPFGARVEVLADGSLIAAVSGGGGATDQAARAARCALAMRESLSLGALAVATGRGILGDDLPLGEAIDRAVSLLRAEQHAARIASAAGRIVLDEVTAGLLDARFELGGEGEVKELRGERLAVLDPARSLLGKPSPCIGRDREIAALEAVLAECAAESVARVVLLTGPPGIGKSRVGHELLGRARKREGAATIWVARGDPMSAGSSWRLLAQMVTLAAGLLPRDPRCARQDKIRAYTERVLAGDDASRVAELLGELTGTPFPDEHRVQLRASRRDARLLGDQIRRALEDLLAAECARGPVLVVLDDLHWADGPSVTFFDNALRDLAERPLMVLGLARPDVHDRFPRLWSERHAQEVRLTELSRKASERLTRLSLGDRASPAAVGRVVAHAEGNPFYLEELIRAFAEGHGDALPGTVRAMVQVRLEALAPAARRVLRAGSIFGMAFWTAGVRALLGDGAGADPLPVLLGELERREIVVRRPEGRFAGEEEYAFRHALVQKGAYGMLTERDRVVGHGLAGAWLVEQAEREAMVLAEHFEQGAEPERAAVWYQQAAEQALEADDLEAALVSSRKVLELGAQGELLGASLLSRAEAHIWRGEFSEARPHAVEAKRLLPSGSDPWFRAVNYVSWTAASVGDFGCLVTLACELGAAVGPVPSASARIGMAMLASQLLLCGFPQEAQPLVERLAPGQSPGGDPLVAGYIHELRIVQAALRGDPSAACLSAQASAAAFEEAGAARDAVRSRRNAGDLLVQLGQFEAAEVELRAAIAVTDRLGLRELSAMAHSSLGIALMYQGNLERARAVNEAAIVALEQHGSTAFAAIGRVYLAAILLGSGDPAGAHALASRVITATDSRLPTRVLAVAVLAQACLAQGRADEALSLAREAMEGLDQLGGIEEGESLVRLTLVDTLRARGNLDEARAAAVSARDHLLARAARISDPVWRASFLAAVPENARTLALAALD